MTPEEFFCQFRWLRSQDGNKPMSFAEAYIDLLEHTRMGKFPLPSQRKIMSHTKWSRRRVIRFLKALKSAKLCIKESERKDLDKNNSEPKLEFKSGPRDESNLIYLVPNGLSEFMVDSDTNIENKHGSNNNDKVKPRKEVKKKASKKQKSAGSKLGFKPVNIYHEIYEDLRDNKPVITQADAVQLTKVAKHVKTENNFREICEAYISDEDNFIAEKGWPGRMLMQKINGYITQLDIYIPSDDDEKKRKMAEELNQGDFDESRLSDGSPIDSLFRL